MKNFLLSLLLAPQILFAAVGDRPLSISTTGLVSPNVGRADKAKIHGNAGATTTFSLKDGNWHTVILDQNSTWTITDWVQTGNVQSLIIDVIQNGGFTITWVHALTGNSSLSPFASTLTRFTLTTVDGGTTITIDSSFAAGIPVTAKTGNYTLVAADADTTIYHPASDNSARTFTIPANATVPFTPGTTVTFVNLAATASTIAITSDTMYLAGAGTTGSRTLAQFGICTAYKLTSVIWIINGTNVTFLFDLPPFNATS